MLLSFIFKYKLKKKLKYKFLEDSSTLWLRTKNVSLIYRKHLHYSLYRYFYKKNLYKTYKYIYQRIKIYINKTYKKHFVLKQLNLERDKLYKETNPYLYKLLNKTNKKNFNQRKNFNKLLKFNIIKYYKFVFTKYTKKWWWWKKNYFPGILKRNINQNIINNTIGKKTINFFALKNKKKIKRLKIKQSLKNKNIFYKGLFYNLTKFSMFYGFINLAILKKYNKTLKFKYKKNNLYNNFLNCKLYILLFNLMFFSNIKKSFFYIRKYGIDVNFTKIYISNYNVKPNDLILIKGKLKKKIYNFFFLNKTFILWLIKNSVYNIILNIRILGFIVLYGNIFFNLNLYLNIIKKKKTKSDFLFNSNYFSKTNFFKRRK